MYKTLLVSVLHSTWVSFVHDSMTEYDSSFFCNQCSELMMGH